MKHNAINSYKHALAMIENPKGIDSQERQMARFMAKNNKAMLEEHFKNSPKYKNDEEIQALLGVKEEPKTVKKVDKKEKEEDGKE